MPTVQPPEPEPCASVGLTMKGIHLSNATSTLASKALVVSTLTVLPLGQEPCASAEVGILETHSQSADWNLAPPARVELMLTVHLPAGWMEKHLSYNTHTSVQDSCVQMQAKLHR